MQAGFSDRIRDYVNSNCINSTLNTVIVHCNDLKISREWDSFKAQTLSTGSLGMFDGMFNCIGICQFTMNTYLRYTGDCSKTLLCSIQDISSYMSCFFSI